MRRRANRDLLRIAAHRLGPLLNEVVFVGGSVVDLYLTDPRSPEVRGTEDVDVLVDVLTRGALVRVDERLRGLGFSEDMGARSADGRDTGSFST